MTTKRSVGCVLESFFLRAILAPLETESSGFQTVYDICAEKHRRPSGEKFKPLRIKHCLLGTAAR